MQQIHGSTLLMCELIVNKVLLRCFLTYDKTFAIHFLLPFQLNIYNNNTNIMIRLDKIIYNSIIKNIYCYTYTYNCTLTIS